ncbi:MAG: hypothetical protein WCX31_11435 [Salinivirgaceae bacterium]|jgi:hypothetical protein
MDAIDIGEHCKILVLKDVPCIHIQWFGLPPSNEFQSGCNKAIELMVENSISKILTDNTNANVFSVKDQHRLNENWLPRAEKAGYRASATLVGNSNAFAKFAAQNIAKRRDQSKFANQFFTSKEEALKWLKSI